MLFIFVGVIIYPDVKSLTNAFSLSLTNLVNSHTLFLKKLSDSKLKGQNLGNYIWKSRIFVIPTIIVLLFLVLYGFSNPIFNNLITKTGIFLQENLRIIFQNFDSLIIVTILIGLVISTFILLRTSDYQIIEYDKNVNEALERTKKNRNKKTRFAGLKNELKASIFLLIILNAIILTLNIIDIYWVWFNFEWSGEYLKQFVHEGTYLLILSIIISIIIVLYFFRGNLNFYKENKLLKYLSFAWLIQNGILTISVAFRNFWYINYFSLAYKRIGVIIFLILTLYGLYSVLVKVKNRKSAFYLFKTNSYFIIVILVICSVFNWDNLIAQYNFRNSDKSFLHLNYLSTLSDKSLPYLDKPLLELLQINKIQKEKFPFEQKFMTPEEYHKIINDRKKVFKNKWESKNLFSWNLPEYMAYKKLFY